MYLLNHFATDIRNQRCSGSSYLTSNVKCQNLVPAGVNLRCPDKDCSRWERTKPLKPSRAGAKLRVLAVTAIQRPPAGLWFPNNADLKGPSYIARYICRPPHHHPTDLWVFLGMRKSGNDGARH